MDSAEIVWFAAVLSTGIAAGAMAGHALLLGRFFQWTFESNGAEAFRLTYPRFIQARRPQFFFDHLFTLALLLVTAYDVILLLSARLCALALLAAGSQWLFVAIFFGSGFASLEGKVLAQGDVSPERVRRFVSLNPRITIVSAILLLASFVLLMLMTLPATAAVR